MFEPSRVRSSRSDQNTVQFVASPTELATVRRDATGQIRSVGSRKSRAEAVEKAPNHTEHAPPPSRSNGLSLATPEGSLPPVVLGIAFPPLDAGFDRPATEDPDVQKPPSLPCAPGSSWGQECTMCCSKCCSKLSSDKHQPQVSFCKRMTRPVLVPPFGSW